MITRGPFHGVRGASSPREVFRPELRRRQFALGAVIMLLAMAGAVGLWARFAATIFFEAFRVGFGVCFG